MDNDPGDEPTVIESETHSGVTNGITASVAYAPKRHKGSPFLVRLEFTGSVPGGYMKMRDEVLNVTNGEVNRAYRTKAGGRHWTFDIGVYDSESPVTITLEGNRSCGDEGAVCGRGGRKLANTLTLTMQGKNSTTVPPIPSEAGRVRTKPKTQGARLRPGELQRPLPECKRRR